MKPPEEQEATPKTPTPRPPVHPRAWRPIYVTVDGVQYEVDVDLRVYTSNTYRVALGKRDGRGREVHETRHGTRRRVKDPEVIRVVLGAVRDGKGGAP